ncbi:hypothetical protein C4K27_5271 [Pseudomonas chlororaphis subsp. chlororaphis]|nr:hypothetical protein C4K27_5271 [Pseudomonas chlororaphis subsp. chlororaphis]
MELNDTAQRFRVDAPGQCGRTLYPAEKLMPRSDELPTS